MPGVLCGLYINSRCDYCEIIKFGRMEEEDEMLSILFYHACMYSFMLLDMACSSAREYSL